MVVYVIDFIIHRRNKVEMFDIKSLLAVVGQQSFVQAI